MQSDRDHLRAAARLALRGHGRAEPNPLVGCVIVSGDGCVVGWGYHERCGGPHAEIHALRRAGAAARGSTAYVTLAPCNHTGRTGPCSKALIEAGIARVVVARDDPHPHAKGGLDALRSAGVEVRVSDVAPEASAVSDPFVHRVQTGLPWLVTKWAQTLDGRIATRTGSSKWISTEASRRMVHRERGRVDAIMTGIGTVRADDPMLTARGVRVRRVARRIIIDPRLEMPLDSRIARSAREVPTTIVHAAGAAAGKAAGALERVGVELLAVEPGPDGLPLADALRELVRWHDISNVLVEAGPGLVSRLLALNLVNEAWVFAAGLLLGDEQAIPPVCGMVRQDIAEARRIKLTSVRRCGNDVVLRYRL